MTASAATTPNPETSKAVRAPFKAAWGLWVLLTGAFTIAALWNGYPLASSDSAAYLETGLGGRGALDGTVAYGGWLRLAEVHGSLWPVALLQAALLAALSFALWRRLSRSSRPALSAAVVAVMLGLATTAPYVAGLLLPDVFLPIALLALALLLLGPARRWQSLLLVAVVVFAASTSLSSLCVLSFAGLVSIGWSTRQHGQPRRRLALCALLLLAGWASFAGLNHWTHASGPFAGIREHLSQTRAESPSTGKWLSATAKTTFKRLSSFGLDADLYQPVGADSELANALKAHAPADLERFRASRQERLLLGDLSTRAAFQILLVLGALLALYLRRDRLSIEVRAIAVLMVAGFVGAALVTALLGLPEGPRSGARVVWLLPLLAMATVADPLAVWSEAKRRWREFLASTPKAAVPRWLHALARFVETGLREFPLVAWTAIAIFLKLLLVHGSAVYEVPAPVHWLKESLEGLWHRDASALFGSMFLVSLGSSLLLTGWTLFLPRKTRTAALVGVNAFVSLLALSDAIYFRYFNDFLSVPVLLQASQVGELGSCIGSLIHWTDLFFGLDLLVALAGWSRQRRAAPAVLPSDEPGRFAYAAVALGLGALLAGSATGYGLVTNPGLLGNTWSRTNLYQVTGLVGLHALETSQLVSGKLFAKKLSRERVADLRGWFEDRARTRGKADRLTGLAKGKNVIVIQMESFQDFLVGRKIAGQEITPNLNALLPKLLYVPNYYHQSAQGRTSDAEFASNCSLLPLQFGSAYVRYPNDRYVCLPEMLRKAGYETAAFHGNNGAFYNRYYVYPRIGFDHFFQLSDFEMTRQVGWALGDRAFFHQSVEKMKGLRKPFYAFLITLTSHYPYDLPDSEKSLPRGPLAPGLLADYVQSVHYLDSALGELVSELKEQGLWDDSVVLMYGDHDDGIPDDDANYEKLFGHPLDPVDQMNLAYRVGMFIHLPGEPVTGKVETVAAQTDLAPTVLDTLGISSAQLPWVGEPVLAPHRPVALRFGSFAGDQLLYLAPSAACIDPVRRERVPSESCASMAADAIDRLNRSEDVIVHDLQTSFIASASAVTE